MVGDTNLFLQEDTTCAEAEIMVAEPEARGKRVGWESLLLMLRWDFRGGDVGMVEKGFSCG